MLVERGAPDHPKAADRKHGGVELILPQRLGAEPVHAECGAKQNEKRNGDRQ
jgi:hypothetical protein